MSKKEVYLKDRFLRAVVKGELGEQEPTGVVVTLKAFKQYFTDIKSQYVSSFLPAATIEKGRVAYSHTKFVFRVRKGAYLVHPGVLTEYIQLLEWENSQSDFEGENANGNDTCGD